MAKLDVLYATSVFELALQSGQVDEISEQAELMLSTLKDSDCKKILTHPHISNAEKLDFFGNIFGGKLHEYLMGLLHVAVVKNRETFVIPALNALLDIIKRHQKKTTAIVLTAAKLQKKQIDEIKKVLSLKLEKSVEVTVDVDESLIGGPFIRVDGYYIDQTVKKRLRDMAARMKEGCNA